MTKQKKQKKVQAEMPKLYPVYALSSEDRIEVIRKEALKSGAVSVATKAARSLNMFVTVVYFTKGVSAKKFKTWVQSARSVESVESAEVMASIQV